MEEPTREMEKETGAETDLPETEPAAEQEEAKKAAEAKEAEAAEETAEDGKERKFFKKKKDKKDEKIEELTDRLTRQMAEFDNFRKRTEKEKANMYAIGAKDIIEKILPVVDSFERGLATVENPEEDPFADGMNKVYKQFTTALDELGVTVIEAVGKEFVLVVHHTCAAFRPRSHLLLQYPLHVPGNRSILHLYEGGRYRSVRHRILHRILPVPAAEFPLHRTPSVRHRY